MAIDTTVGEFEYPGRGGARHPPERLPGSGRRSDWLRPNVLWAMAGGVVGYLIGHWLGNVIASGYQQVQGSGQNDVAIVLGLSLGVVGLDGRHRCLQLPVGQGARLRALARSPAAELGALLPHDRRPQGRRDAVRRRGPAVPLHRRPARHAHPDGAAEPDEPRLRSRDLHRHRRRARHDHDDDGLLGRRGAPRELADPPDDRVTAHGLPPRRGLLVLDLHGGIPRHPQRTVLRRLPDRVDRLRPPADAGLRRDGLLSGRLRGHRHRHDPGRLQPRLHHHQLPGARHDVEPTAHLRLERPGDQRAPHPGDADARRGVPVRESWTARPRPPSS